MTEEIFDTYGKDPIALYKDWLSEAEASEPNDPDAACIATCGADGKPSARMILVKDIEESGIKFHTNENSAKGQDLSENPQAALCVYWKSTRKQIRIEGAVKQVGDDESDAYFTSRPRARQIGAWASQQSKPYETQSQLKQAIEKYETEFEGKDIPRPPYWKGYRLIPASIEFWIGQKDRVHTRFLYTKQGDGSWSATWLFP